MPRLVLFFLCLGVAPWIGRAATTHPCLLLNAAEVAEIRANLGKLPLFDREVEQARAQVDRALQAPLEVPVPRDVAGGTHERHKRNYVEMQLAGFLYQATGDVRYATFVKEMLLRYADLYPKLGSHPGGRGSAPGRLFWQTLNEAVWLVNASQAYDCVYEALAPDERARIERDVLRAMAKFLSEDRAREFDRIHNHGTWAVTAVGMAGYAMGDDTLVRKALHGTKLDDRGGYFRQLDELFSPDGYYCEGPYYARYALMPFLLFAQAIENNQPELKVFSRRDELLRKAVYALFQQTSPGGAFMPFNDALKEKDVRSDDAVLAVDFTYARYGHDVRLLSVARQQQSVVLGVAGLEVAKGLATTPRPPAFPYASVALTDGADGKAGGLGILRTETRGESAVAVLKYTAFGMEHGHYDKLALLYYDQGREIIPDYGSARFLNVDQKDGGRYLKENTSFAKQTIAHNTVVVDGQSNYNGVYDEADTRHAEAHFFDVKDPDFQVVSAIDRTAYPGVAMQRTLVMLRDERLAYPVLVDVYRVTSASPHRFDQPFYYAGQFLRTNVKLTNYPTQRPVLGEKAGYQHLWVAAEGKAAGPVRFTWMNGDRFYTLTAAANDATRVYFLQVGANDPDFNLRNESAIMLRAENQSAHVFAAVIEPHGKWDGVKEQTSGGEPVIRGVTVLGATEEATVVRVTGERGLRWTILLSNRQPATGGAHRVTIGDETLAWDGNAAIRR